VFYDAGHVLSAIAKFVVYLLEERKERREMEGGRERVRRQGGAYGEAGNRNTRYKMQHICHLGTSPWGYRPVTSLESSFSRAKFALQIVCLNIEPFTRYLYL